MFKRKTALPASNIHQDSLQGHEELELSAYNAAFHELGLRWYWSRDTYLALQRHSLEPETRVRHYLESQQSHLLKAYDSAFLVQVIIEKQGKHLQQGVESKFMDSGFFDWSQMPGQELGV